MTLMADKLQYAWRDFDGDRQQISLDWAEGADLEVDWNALKTALDLYFDIGEDAGGGYFEQLQADTGATASSPSAQLSVQAIVEYKDTTNGKSYIERIPMPNLSKASDAQTPPQPAYTSSNGLTILNPLHSDYATLANALAQGYQTRAGNFATVTRIYIEE